MNERKLLCFRDVMVSVNKLCRDCGDIKFFAGDIFGFFGYCFLDLVKHEYVEEVKVRNRIRNSFFPFSNSFGIRGLTQPKHRNNLRGCVKQRRNVTNST